MYKSFSRSLTAFPVLYYQILKFNFNKRFRTFIFFFFYLNTFKFINFFF